MSKRALITGITGQDGSYLAELLLQKDYEVFGLRRRSSLFNTNRIDHLLKEDSTLATASKLTLMHGDMVDAGSLHRVLEEVRPNEVYHLAAQSHVAVSFHEPEYTAQVDALGTLRILETIKLLGLERKTKFYQASSSELYGKVQTVPQNESTPFYPRSPYAVSKLFAYWTTVNYRESYNIFACNGILFNHESPVRGETFVSRKISRGLCRVKLGLQKCLYLGNLDAKRDWGHAKDFVYAMWLILQQELPDDYVIATGEQHSVREFVNLAAKNLGMNLLWEGTGLTEKAHDEAGNVVVAVNPDYFRPAEVDSLLGDASKAKQKLGWSPSINFEELVEDMVRSDYREAQKELLLRKSSSQHPNLEVIHEAENQ